MRYDTEKESETKRNEREKGENMSLRSYVLRTVVGNSSFFPLSLALSIQKKSNHSIYFLFSFLSYLFLILSLISLSLVYIIYLSFLFIYFFYFFRSYRRNPRGILIQKSIYRHVYSLEISEYSGFPFLSFGSHQVP